MNREELDIIREIVESAYRNEGDDYVDWVWINKLQQAIKENKDD